METTASKSDPLFHGRYLFHFHTRATDGHLEVADYFSWALEHGYEKLIFLEHIRRNPSYDVDAFIGSVEEMSQRTGIAAVAGFEAKVLPDGGLDIDERHVRRAGALGIAEHGFKADLDTLERALADCFTRYDRLREAGALVWVHPGLWLKKHSLMERERSRYLVLLERARAAGVPVERNMRYDLTPEEIFAQVPERWRVAGVDAHSAADLTRYLTWRASSITL